MIFFDAESGGGDGGGTPPAGGGEVVSRGAAAFEPVTKTTTGEPPLPKPKTPEVPAQTGPKPEAGAGEPPATPEPPFDASKFAKEFGATLSETLRPVIDKATPTAPPMTPEEAKRILNVWEPDDNWYAQYDNLETRADAVAAMRDGLIRQADTLNQLRMREAIDQLREEIMPGFQMVSQTANQQREERLHSRYPQLAKPEMQPLVHAIATDMVQRQQTFTSETELFKALANGVEAVLKQSNPEFKLESPDNGAPQPVDRGGRQLPVTTPGGGGGAGRRADDSKPAKPRGLAVFDK